jgi:hypothetical protein
VEIRQNVHRSGAAIAVALALLASLAFALATWHFTGAGATASPGANRTAVPAAGSIQRYLEPDAQDRNSTVVKHYVEPDAQDRTLLQP